MSRFSFHTTSQSFQAQMNSGDSEETFSFGSQTVNNDDYTTLKNKPSINEVILVGQKTLEDIGVEEITNLEIDQLFSSIF